MGRGVGWKIPSVTIISSSLLPYSISSFDKLPINRSWWPRCYDRVIKPALEGARPSVSECLCIFVSTCTGWSVPLQFLINLARV